MRAPALDHAALLCLLALCACAGPSPQPPRPGEPPPAPAAPAVAPQLAAEQRWLRDLFQGTPVSIEPAAGGALRLEVPLTYAFEAGRPAIKPPLAAVLDKVAASLTRLPRTRLQAAAPTPEGLKALRDALVARGVAAHRVGSLPARPDAVELRLLPAPAAIERLEDPPPLAAGRR